MSRSACFLRDLAQNDYMIDQHLLPTGQKLHKISSELECLRMAAREMAKRLRLVAWEARRKGDVERAQIYDDIAAYGEAALIDE